MSAPGAGGEARIRELEAASRVLDPGAAERATLREPVIDYTERFLDDLPTAHTWNADGNTGRGLYDSPIAEDGISIDEAVRLFDEHVEAPALNPVAPGQLGYIPTGGLYASALGDYLAAVTNRYAGFFFASPGAVRMENMLLRWMAGVVGYPEDSAGALLSGGSIANLTGIVTARDAHGLRGRDLDRTVVYLTSQAHHSVAKALRIAGLAECVVRQVPVDARYRMDAAALKAMVTADCTGGRRPWLVVATAGTTDVGAVDPLEEIAAVCEEHGLWFHVDGAYGALFALCESARPILRGMEASDSLVLDPHKALFLPYGTGAVLVKDREALMRAHEYSAGYMQDAEGLATDELSPAELSPELTKHFRGLRLWLPLKLCGVRPFRAALEEKMLLARYFRERLAQVPGFEVGPEPDLSVTYFRYVPERGDANAFNQELSQAIQRDGRVFLSTTTLDGVFVIRLAVLSFRTHLETIETALEVIRREARALSAT